MVNSAIDDHLPSSGRQERPTMTVTDAASSSAPPEQFLDIDVQELRAFGLGGESDQVIRLYSRKYSPYAEPALVWMQSSYEARSGEAFCVSTVRALGIVVAEVQYRLPTPASYPRLVSDGYAALEFLHTHAEPLGVDPTAIAVGGLHAAAGLAADLALQARDEGQVPLVFQLLEEPDFDPASTAPRVALAGLPPAYVRTTENDQARNVGSSFATSLLDAGVSVELHSFLRPPTGFRSSSFTAVADRQRQQNELLYALARGLGVDRTFNDVESW